MKVQISFLGRRVEEGGYRDATYLFENGSRIKSQYFGMALWRYLRSQGQTDSLILYGTTTSAWDVFFLEMGLGGDALEVAERIPSSQDPAKDMAFLSKALSQALGGQVTCSLIPSGESESAQIKMLADLAEQIPAGSHLIIDVTNGYRHLSTLSIVMAKYLGNLKDIQIQDVVYGAFDMRSESGDVPVVPLRFLLQMLNWIEAFAKYDASGSYRYFSELLTQEGFPADKAEQLVKASFLERITNQQGARQSLNTVSEKLSEFDGQLTSLFKPDLLKRLSWSQESSRSRREFQLSEVYQSRGDYLRAVIYLQEGYITAMTQKQNLMVDDYQDRETSKREFCRQLDEFKELSNIRNAFAHGVLSLPEHSSKRSQDLKRSLTDSEFLDQKLREIRKAFVRNLS